MLVRSGVRSGGWSRRGRERDVREERSWSRSGNGDGRRRREKRDADAVGNERERDGEAKRRGTDFVGFWKSGNKKPTYGTRGHGGTGKGGTV